MASSSKDEDEFDIDDDITLDHFAEESLAQVEQQHLRATQAQSRERKSVGVDDFRISHKGRVLPGHNLPRAENEDAEDAAWGRMDLDAIESEAVAASQSSSTSARYKPKSPLKQAQASASPSKVARSATHHAQGKRQRDAEDAARGRFNTSRPRIDEDLSEERSGNEARIKELLRQLEQKDEELKRMKTENQSKIGEVSILRANFNRTVAEHSALYKEKEEDMARQRALARELQQKLEMKENEIRTVQAFRGFEASTNTNNIPWSSVNASVARRRELASSRRDFSQSHSQTAAAAAGLITPTRRKGRNSIRALGSPTSSQGHSASRLQGEESPSSRQAKRQSSSEAGAKSASMRKKDKFPGFVDSFAKPVQPTPKHQQRGELAASSSQETRSVIKLTQAEHRPSTPEDMMDDILDGPPRSPDRERNSTRQPLRQFYWAVSTYSRRQAALSSLVLSHTSRPCPALNSKGDFIKNGQAIDHSTLQRILRSPLSSTDDPYLFQEYAIAAQHLLHVLSQGAAMDAEERFAYLLPESDIFHDSDGHQTEKDTFYECMDLMELGLNEVLAGVCNSLRIMMGVAFRIGAVEHLYDVFVLTRSIAIHHAAMSRLFIVTRCPQFTSNQAYLASESALQYTPSKLKRLDVDFEQIAVACVSLICLPQAADQKTEGPEISPSKRRRRNVPLPDSRGDERWRQISASGSQIGCALLQSVLGIIEVLALEVQHNDEISLRCTSALKSIFEAPDIVASLLSSKQDGSIIQRTIGLMTILVRHESLWKTFLACNMDSLRPSIRPSIQPTKTSDAQLPGQLGDLSLLFAVLAKVLVDGRLSLSETAMHDIHAVVIVFLQQMIICHTEAALPLVAGSGTILAGIVKCLQIDTDFIWNVPDDFKIEAARSHHRTDILNEKMRATKRIEMDVQLMGDIYLLEFGRHKRSMLGTSLGDQLAKKLASYETQLLLNGIRHYFVVSMSRIAFAAEPEWMMENSNDTAVGGDDDDSPSPDDLAHAAALESARTSLNNVNEAAAELLELVLSPDEIENCWEALNDEVEDDDEDELEAAQAAGSRPSPAKSHSRQPSQGRPLSQRGGTVHREQEKGSTIIVSDTDDESDTQMTTNER